MKISLCFRKFVRWWSRKVGEKRAPILRQRIQIAHFVVITAEFRYEGIILVHKNSDIRSLADLRGKKSCHTGFGRNVGYKIPITKLKKIGVLKTSNSPSKSPVEKELAGLSQLFSKSCLVGTYSPQDDVNQMLSKNVSRCGICGDFQ